MAKQRAYRWAFFFTAIVSFFYAVFRRADPWAVIIFFVSGAIWVWLERRKTRELDAPRPK